MNARSPFPAPGRGRGGHREEAGPRPEPPAGFCLPQSWAVGKDLSSPSAGRPVGARGRGTRARPRGPGRTRVAGRRRRVLGGREKADALSHPCPGAGAPTHRRPPATAPTGRSSDVPSGEPCPDTATGRRCEGPRLWGRQEQPPRAGPRGEHASPYPPPPPPAQGGWEAAESPASDSLPENLSRRRPPPALWPRASAGSALLLSPGVTGASPAWPRRVEAHARSVSPPTDQHGGS